MQRRNFITLMSSAVTFPFGARAEQVPPPLIGMLHVVSAARWADRMDGFYRGLNEGGFAEGHNVVIEYRWAEGQ